MDDRAQTTAQVESAVVAFLRTAAVSSGGDALATALADVLLGSWPARQASVFLLDGTREALDAVAHHGLTTEERAGYSHVPLELGVPIAEVARSGVEGWFRLADVATRYPALSDWVAHQPDRDTGEVLVTPVRSAGRVVGVLVVTFSDPVEQTWALRSVVDAAVSAVALWAAPGALAPAPSRLRRRETIVTARQTRIVELVRRGMSNADIAEELSCSVGTVKAELARLFRLVGAGDRGELVRLAEQSGF